MATAKKEKVEKVKKENINLPKEKQGRLKTYSKIIYILTRIAKVCLIIGIAFLALTMIIAPVLVKNIKIENGTIEVFDNKLEYVERDGKVALEIKGEPIGTLTSEEKVSFDYIIKELENANISKTFAYIEITIALGVVAMFVLYFILKRIDKLFTNIHDFDTPFNDANLEHIRKIAYLSLALIIVRFVSDLFSQLVLDSKTVNVDIVSIVTVMIIYVGSLVFEYACNLQKESKATIYTEISK